MLEHARRPVKPRHVPLGTRRGTPLPRPDALHPSGCTCGPCTLTRGPADNRDGLGCALLAFAIQFSIGAGAVAIGVGSVFLMGGRAGVALIFGVAS